MNKKTARNLSAKSFFRYQIGSAMARRKENPLLQAAKGFPGRRKSAVTKEIEAAANAAEQEKPVAGNAFPLPAVFSVAPVYWKRAIEVWDTQADVLKAHGRRRPGYRAALTRFCIWTQFYEAAANALRRDLPKGQLTVKWEMGHGAIKIMPHPSLDIMKDAEGMLRLLEGEFGFTPRGDSDLTRVETFNAGQGRLPFGPGAAPGQAKPASGEADDVDQVDNADLMNSTDSLPPGQQAH